MTHSLQEKEAFILKGSLQTMTIMHLNTTDLSGIEHHLHYIVSQTPKFFNQLPLLIELEAIQHDPTPIDFNRFIELLRAQNIILVGIRNGHENHIEAAKAAGIGILPERKSVASQSNSQLISGSATPKPAPQATVPTTRLVTQPVRSGQQVYAKGGDLIITSSVSEGAEVLADGHIHIYGTLRGRALAGLSGNTQARIFCHELDAELVSIAGQYKIHEQIHCDSHEMGWQVFLQDEKIAFAKL